MSFVLSRDDASAIPVVEDIDILGSAHRLYGVAVAMLVAMAKVVLAIVFLSSCRRSVRCSRHNARPWSS